MRDVVSARGLTPQPSTTGHEPALAVRVLHHRCARAYRWSARNGRRAQPSYITLASQIGVPIGLRTAIQLVRPLEAPDIWMAIVLGHFTRALLSVLRFRQGKWRRLRVEIGRN